MASWVSVMARALNIKEMHIDRVEYVEGAAQRYGEEYRRDRIEVHARPYKRASGRCPVCGRKRPTYDHQAKSEAEWRASPLNGVPIVIMYRSVRVSCPDHGVLTESIPWSDGGSHFTEGFDDEVAFLALTCPKTVVSQFMGINWRTVGNCVAGARGAGRDARARAAVRAQAGAARLRRRAGARGRGAARRRGRRGGGGGAAVGEDEYRAALEELKGFPRRGRPSKRKAEPMATVAAYEAASAPPAALSDEHREALEALERRAREIRGTKCVLQE